MQIQVDRALGGMERLFHQHNGVGSTNFCVVLFVEGALQLDGLEAALDELLRIYPRIGARIVANPRLTFEAPAQAVKIPYHIVERDSPEHWRALGEQVVLRKHGDARIDFTIVHGFEASEIIIGIDHALADGQSAYAIAKAFILCMNGERLPSYPVLGAMEERNPRAFRGFGAWQRAFRYAGRTLKRNPRAGHRFGEDVPSQTTSSAGLHLSKEQLGALKRNADAAEASLNAALCAACMQSAYAVFGGAEPTVLCLNTPTNLRKHIEPAASNEELGLFISGILQWHELGPDTDIWHLARGIRQGILTALEEEGPLKLGLLAGAPKKPSKPVKPNRFTARFEHSLTVTNPGRFDVLPALNGCRVTRYRTLVSVWAKESLTFLIQGYGDELFLDVQVSNEKFASSAKSSKELALDLEERLRIMASCAFGLS